MIVKTVVEMMVVKKSVIYLLALIVRFVKLIILVVITTLHAQELILFLAKEYVGVEIALTLLKYTHMVNIVLYILVICVNPQELHYLQNALRAVHF